MQNYFFKFRLNIQLFAEGEPMGTDFGTSDGSDNPTGTDNPSPNPATNPSTDDGKTNPTGGTNPTPSGEKTFTQSQVNDIVRERLTRQYNRYGVKDKSELDGMISKARSYDVMKERFDKMSDENSGLNEKVAFLTQNVNPDKYDDVRAYFKGKELLFNEGNLAEAIKTHPEWLNAIKSSGSPTTTIKVIGSETNSKPHRTERELASKLFGVDL